MEQTRIQGLREGPGVRTRPFHVAVSESAMFPECQGIREGGAAGRAVGNSPRRAVQASGRRHLRLRGATNQSKPGVQTHPLALTRGVTLLHSNLGAGSQRRRAVGLRVAKQAPAYAGLVHRGLVSDRRLPVCN